MSQIIRFLLSLVLVAGLGSALAGDAPPEAKQTFQRYVQLGQSFDPRLADLYADAAVIRNKRLYPDGQVREMSIPAPQYKRMIRDLMPTAQARGDRNTFSNVKFTPEGDRVRVTATRYSELKRYGSPISLLLERSPSGTWSIVEELSESRP